MVDGLPVKLALQERKSPDFDEPLWMLSWRRYSPDGSNRRFYHIAKGGCWTIPAVVALELIEEMDALGGLDEEGL